MLSDQKAIAPGSFDPVTRGHLEVISLAASLFEVLQVAVVVNPAKTALFSLAERMDLLRAEVAELPGHGRIEVVSFSGLAVDLARASGARWLVRGLRSAQDAASELPMALSNRRCGVEPVETLFLPASAETLFISSTLVREIAAYGGQLGAFVTPRVEAALRRKLALSR